MILIQGNKRQIAKKLLAAIPPAEHFYDLFGGGGSMTEAALQTNKWPHVHYNELQQGLYLLLKEVWEGTFDIHKAETTWISREDFKRLKDEPTAWGAWVKYWWSFSKGGNSYLYSQEVEESQKAVFTILLKGFGRLPLKSMYEKHLAWREMLLYIAKKYNVTRQGVSRVTGKPWVRFNIVNKNCICESIVRNQTIENVVKLTKGVITRQPQTTCGSYNEVDIAPHSVVYCDIPYNDKNGKPTKYSTAPFDRQAFLDWAATRPFPVYISEYNIADTRFSEVLCIEKHAGNTLSGKSNATHRKTVYEKLYWNGVK